MEWSVIILILVWVTTSIVLSYFMDDKKFTTNFFWVLVWEAAIIFLLRVAYILFTIILG